MEPARKNGSSVVLVATVKGPGLTRSTRSEFPSITVGLDLNEENWRRTL